jgi:hypothetical protein
MPAISRASSASLFDVGSTGEEPFRYLSQLQVHSRKRVDKEIMKSKIKCKKYSI